MKLKNIKSYILAVAFGSIATFSSCENYLDVENPSTISQESVFSNVGYTGSAVTSVYNRLMGDDAYGSRLAYIVPTADDFTFLGEWSALGRTGFAHFSIDPAGNADLRNPLTRLYEGIERANVCIYYIPRSNLYNNGTAAERALMRKYHGEALTLRAQFYYEIVRNWGDAPAQFEPSANITDLYIPKTDRDEIYKQLLDDLRLAQDLVPWKSESGDPSTRVTKSAVKALRARIALAAGGYSLRKDPKAMARPTNYLDYYTIARNECWEIMQQKENALNPSFEGVFRSLHGAGQTDPTNEVIWRAGAAGISATTDSKLGVQAGPRIASGSRYGVAQSLPEAVPTYFYAFDSIGDSRRDVTLAYFQVTSTDQKELINVWRHGKYRKYWSNVKSDAQYAGIDWPLIRYADVLLMFAEAENEINGNPTTAAVQAYEEVRKRAFFDQWEARMGQTPATKEAFFNAIVKERYLEFGGEGIRRYDLLRWNLLETTIEKTRHALQQMRAREGRYANVPTTIYYRRNALIGESVTAHQEMQNLDLFGASGPDKIAVVMYTPSPATAPTGYTAFDWRSAVPEAVVTGANRKFASQFVRNSRELLPFPAEYLNRNFRLTQDFGI